ncbi:MAG: SDR family NAD(P)-dependent oxidoreductase [Myxococcota bacterium]|nr:SDR family NAD(P)-dependent oxidoreductase [Myxococcota bacterium]
MKQTTAIVTGASSGIGAALARALGRRGATVVLSARREDALRQVAREVEAAGGRAVVHPGDVTLESDRVTLVERAWGETGRLDLLVNNAGRGYYGGVAAIDRSELEALMALNVVAPLRLAQLALEHLRRNRGTIVMMSSLAGVVAAPRMGAYASSKFALEALSMSLRAELSGSGIRVVVVRPGPVDTPFRQHAVTTDGHAGVRPRGAGVQTPDHVAEQTLRAIDRGKAVVETTPFVRAISAAARLAPGPMRWLSAMMHGRTAS